MDDPGSPDQAPTKNPVDLLDRLRALALPPGDFAVFGSGPLIVRGIIAAVNDLDVVSRGAAWKRALELGNLVYLAEHDVEVVSFDDGAITVGTSWAYDEFDIDQLIDTAEIIDGLPFVRLEHVVAYKEAAGRPKDLAHLRALADHRGQRPVPRMFAMDRHDALLTRSFELAAEARDAGDHPFGALLAVGDDVVAEARNRVNTDGDITAHAETHLVRVLERRGLFDRLSNGTVYASCEPCPMCVGALFWAGVRRVTYGLSAVRLMDLATAPGHNPMGFALTAHSLGATATPPMQFDGPHRENEAAIPHMGFWVP